MNQFKTSGALSIEQEAKFFSICMAYDAFRLCMGMKPKTFTKEEILKWINIL